jgi:diguanylate cyclase (GGDEF)-like protein
MSIDGLEQVSAMMGLTRQRDGIGLTALLIDSLCGLFPQPEVCVLEVYGHRRLDAAAADAERPDLTIRRFAESAHRVPKSDLGPGIMEAVEKLRAVAVESPLEGVGRLVIPLWGEVGPLRLVVLDRIPMDPVLRAQVLQLIDVYANLIRMMDSRERDQLTGLLNRQIFATLFGIACRRAAAAPRQRLWLGVLDIDHFKRINDNYGHLYGDEVLIHFARLMERSFRYTDDIFRFGGEEFIVLMGADVPEAPASAFERFRRLVEEHDFPGVGRVTVSIGYVECTGGLLPTSYIDRADKALYHAKETGRNRVVSHALIGDGSAAEAGGVDLF